MADEPLTREFLQERDLRIYELRKRGRSIPEIAKTFGMSARAVTNALSRQLGRLNRDTALSYPEVVRLELERLDQLQDAIWPMTQFRKVRMGDDEIVVEPDLKAIQQVMAIMDRRAKLLGLDMEKVDLQVDVGEGIRASIAGHEKSNTNKIDRREETLRMLELMGKSGVFEPEAVTAIMHQLNPSDEKKSNEDDEIVDAEVVEDE